MYFEDDFVTQDQLSKKLNISKVTIWRMLKQGNLPKMVTINSRSKRWIRADINDYLQSLTNTN
ncbi:MAG: helix-turn-helix domain-containing protein [Colwellia sp.]|uniref:helix-turn-helix transcriptional regulator n=1 Tax=Alteromonadales TaxID=135622 RepID=UPI001D8C39F7|nr:helix-turn-helix domain-containing protein [Colwellia sp.]NRA80596.1 helix-turn-helix domain-containing protein [Pseudoalteromonas sp.]